MSATLEGGRPVGAPTGQGRDYPLVRPSADVQGLLADVQLWHRVRDVRLPLRITRLVGMGQPQSLASSEPGQSETGDAFAAGVLIADANDQAVFDSQEALAYSGRTWGPRLFVHQWQTATASCLILQHTQEAEETLAGPQEDDLDKPQVLLPERAVLDERCSNVEPLRLDGVTLLGRTVGEAFELEAGANTRITVLPGLTREHSLRRRVRLLVDLTAGGGSGRYPGCEAAEPLLRSVNGIRPDAHGNLALSAKDCLWLRPRHEGDALDLEILIGLAVGSQCQPCCSCADYIKVYKALALLNDRYKVLGVNGEALRDSYQAGAERWRAAGACQLANPASLRLVSASPSTVVVQGSFRNSGSDCLEGPALRFTLTPSPLTTTPTLVPGSSYTTDVASGEWRSGGVSQAADVVTARWDRLGAGQAARCRFSLLINPGSNDPLTQALVVALQAELGPPAGPVTPYGAGVSKSILVQSTADQAMRVV